MSTHTAPAKTLAQLKIAKAESSATLQVLNAMYLDNPSCTTHRAVTVAMIKYQEDTCNLRDYTPPGPFARESRVTFTVRGGSRSGVVKGYTEDFSRTLVEVIGGNLRWVRTSSVSQA